MIKRISIPLFLFILLLIGTAKAQSLGDPVVRITFGSGTSTRGPALAADSGSTTYTYSSGQIGENYYTISNSIGSAVHSGFTTSSDHTGDPGGYMMIVNGNLQPGTIFTRKVPGLCGNTSYQFGVWIENVLASGGILPNMVFHIYASDGITELGTGISTGDVSNRTWKFYSANFTLPAGTDGVVIKLVSNASGTQGNDFAIDDLTFSPYDASSISVAFDGASSSTTQTTCAGSSQSYTIKATSTLPANRVQKLQAYINGAWVDQSTPGTQTSFTITSPTTAGTYNYRLVTSIADNIGSASCVTASNQLTINVTAGPNAVIGAPANTCLGDATIFTDQSTSSGTTITNWLWTFGNGQTSTQQNPTYTYPSPGDYPVTLTVSGGTTCTSTTTKTIHVSAVPKASYTASAADCSTREVTFTDTSKPGEGSLTVWNWDFGDKTTEVRTNATAFKHQYANTGNFPVKLTITSSTGCTAVASGKTVSVYPLPVISVTLPDVCTNDAAAQFVNNTTIADGSAITYSWSFGDGGTSTLKSPSHKYAAAATYNLTLKATSAYGCTVQKDFTFTVNGDNPRAVFTVKNSSALCSSEDIVFDITNSGPSFGSTTKLIWYWDYDNQPTVSQTITKDQLTADKLYRHNYGAFNSPASKKYHVRLIVYSGGETCSSAPYDMTITLNANPLITVGKIGPVCLETGTVQISENKNGFVGTGVFSGKGVSASGLFDPTVSGAGTFKVSYLFTSSVSGCTYNTTQDVVVYPTPTVSAGADFGMLEGSQVKLKATADGENPLKYKWTLANGSTATAMSSDTELNPTTSTKDDVAYMLTVTSVNGCSASAIVNIKVLKTPVIPNTITPNADGVNDIWNIKYLDTYTDCTVDIFSRAGVRLFTSIGYTKAWDGTFNGQQLPAGVYYYVIDPKHGRDKMSGSLTVLR